jgi:hypothetical protein
VSSGSLRCRARQVAPVQPAGGPIGPTSPRACCSNGRRVRSVSGDDEGGNGRYGRDRRIDGQVVESLGHRSVPRVRGLRDGAVAAGIQPVRGGARDWLRGDAAVDRRRRERDARPAAVPTLDALIVLTKNTQSRSRGSKAAIRRRQGSAGSPLPAVVMLLEARRGSVTLKRHPLAVLAASMRPL